MLPDFGTIIVSATSYRLQHEIGGQRPCVVVTTDVQERQSGLQVQRCRTASPTPAIALL